MGALIYRESQLRKAEAAAKAAESKLSSAVSHLRTSTRNRSAKRERHFSLEEDPPRKMVPKKQYRKKCTADGCNNQAKKEGVCNRHGAKVKLCSSDGCTNIAVKGGVCIRHGAKVKLCSSEGCTNMAKKRGVCQRHGAMTTKKKCSREGCTNFVQNGGVCIRHGASWSKKKCSREGCTNQAKRGGVCKRHGAYRERDIEQNFCSQSPASLDQSLSLKEIYSEV